MRYRYLLLSAALLLWLRPALAQTSGITYAQHIGPLIYTHCSSCHHDGDVAPFSLMNYQEVAGHASTIQFTTGIRYMPPWKADPSYSHFLDENTLTNAEIQQINDWINDGMPRGDSTLEPPAPTFPSGSTLGTPDLVIPMAEAFTHQGNNQDLYRIFVLPTHLTVDREIAALEFRPGNRRIVHHAIAALDTTGTARQRDAAAAGYGYTQFGGFGFTPTTDNLAGWVPGTMARSYPSGLSKTLFKGADLVVQVHYGPTAQTQADSSVVNLFFTPPPVPQAPLPRQVQTFPISVFSLTNGPFVIPANQVKTFHGRITVPTDASLLSVLPHAHLLGKSWQAWAVKPSGDTIPLIRINDWDFNWQGSYRFPRMLKLPAGTQVFIDATYDNTDQNPRNPFSPPQQVTWGDQTTAEMYVFYLDVVPYQPGDENIVLGGHGLDDGIAPGLQRPVARLYPPAPNPAGGGAPLTIGFTLPQAAPVSLLLTDAQGRVVRQLATNERYPPGGSQVSVATSGLAPGLYLLQFETPGARRQTQKLMVY